MLKTDTIMLGDKAFTDFITACGLLNYLEAELETKTDADYKEPPTTVDTCEGSDKYMVECISAVPRVKELFHTFHSAYLFAYQVSEGQNKQVEIAHKDKYIMRVIPGGAVFWY